MQWYYSKNGIQLGPVEETELRAKLGNGEIAGTDMVWREGMTDWLPAARVPDLAMLTAPSSVSQPGPGAGGSHYSPPMSAPYQQTPGLPIPNYLWQSIVVTILCCWPFGIPAIVYAAKVDGLKSRGDIAGAMEASANAKKWCLVAVVSWVVLIVLWLVFVGVAGFAGSSGSFN